LQKAENDFVSEWLLHKHPSVGKVFTSGLGVKLFKNPVWAWQGSSSPFIYTSWWQGTEK
jgi:hypothetical protein